MTKRVGKLLVRLFKVIKRHRLYVASYYKEPINANEADWLLLILTVINGHRVDAIPYPRVSRAVIKYMP